MTSTVDRGRVARRMAWPVAVVVLVAVSLAVVSADVTGSRPLSVSRLLAGLAEVGGWVFGDGDRPYRSVSEAAAETLIVSIAAAGSATLASVVLVPLAAGGGRRRILAALVQWVFRVARSVPELVWALVAVFVVRPGPAAAVAALAVHNAGVIGRLAVDVVDTVDRGPVDAVRSTGASAPGTLALAILPQVAPRLLTFVAYRWEVMIRATVVVGFVAGSGLGAQFRLALSFFRWTELGVILIAYVVLVWAVDLASSGLRRLAV